MFFKLVLILAFSKVLAGVVINRCCPVDHTFSAVHDTCEPRVGGKISSETSEKNFTRMTADSPTWGNSLFLSKAFVKILHGINHTDGVEFTFQSHLPRSTCVNGMFLKSFCIGGNESDCSNNDGMDTLLLTTRGELRVGNEYYSALEYCLAGKKENRIDFRICKPTCTEEVPCVRKCCDVDEIWNLGSDDELPCVPSPTVTWQPHFFSTAKHPLVIKHPETDIRPHYFVSRPTDWCTVPGNKWVLEQKEETSGKLNWQFRIGTSQNIFYRTSRYSWKAFSDSWNYSCVDGGINSMPRSGDQTDIFEGIPEEDVLYECSPDAPPQRTRSTFQLALYGFARIASCVFLLATLIVHLLLWKRQNLHGWTLMSYCLSLFILSVFYTWKYFHSLSAINTGQIEPLCVFKGVAINFLYISTFCWMSMINFDLWWTFRSLNMISKSGPWLKRYLAYAAVSLVTPTIFVVTGLALDFAYGSDPESGVIVPEYGRKQCGLEPDTAEWTFELGPAGIFWLFNIFFFASTVYSIYSTQESTKFARSSKPGSGQDTGARVKLFGKLLIVMGILFAFEFISTFDEGTSFGDSSWYWVILDMVNYLQGVYIFFIFVFKEDVRRHLAEKCPYFPGFGLKSPSSSAITTSKETASSSVAGAGSNTGSNETEV